MMLRCHSTRTDQLARARDHRATRTQFVPPSSFSPPVNLGA